MSNYSLTQIKDLSVVLKDMERYVKNPQFLRVGREFKNFALRPREVLANWLLCAVGNFNNNNDFLTFTDDPTGGDGIILDKKNGQFMLTEHVFIPEPKQGELKSVEDLMVKALEHKMKNGPAYAKGKHLVIFSEGIGLWYPNRVGRRIQNNHQFESVWAVGLEMSDRKEYRYWVTRLMSPPINCPSWKISIDFNFNKWDILRVQ